MTPTALFIGFALFSVASLGAGYVMRKRDWMDEEWSRPMHFYTMVLIWSPTALFSIWRLPLQPEVLWLIAVQVVLVAGVGLGAIPLAKLLDRDPRRVGVMAAAAGLGNIGLTLGAYLCYLMIIPSDEALAYAMGLTIVMHVLGVIVLFPVCRYYGEAVPGESSLARLIVANLVDIRALAIHFALLGLILAILEVPFPLWVEKYYLLDALFWLGGLGTYLGIGLRLRFADAFRFMPHHGLLALIRFGLNPLLIFGLLVCTRLTPLPVEGAAWDVILLQSFMPTAVMTVMLANLFHLDTRLASMAFVWNTAIFLVFVLPVLLIAFS